MEIISKQRLALAVKSGDANITPLFPNSFPFNLDHHIDMLASSDNQPQPIQQTRVTIVNPEEVAIPKEVGSMSSCTVYFPKGTEHCVDQVCQSPVLGTAVFAQAEEQELSITVVAEFPISQQTKNSFVGKYFRAVFVTFEERWNDLETGQLNEYWEVHSVGFTGKLYVQRQTEHDLSGALQVDKKEFLLKFLIKQDKLFSYQYGGKGLAGSFRSASLYSPDREGTYETQQEYAFGQLRNHLPHGNSNIHRKSFAPECFSDGIFQNGRVLFAATPETGECKRADAKITYAKREAPESKRYTQIEMVSETEEHYMEGTVFPRYQINYLTFHGIKDGLKTEGFFKRADFNAMKNGSVKDKLGRSVEQHSEYKEAIMAYASLITIKVGNGSLDPACEQFVDSAVRLCNKLTFPYEEDYEPPRISHNFSEEQFKQWVANLSVGKESRIVHVVLLPDCRSSREQLRVLAEKLSLSDTLILSDFCADKASQQFYDSLLFMDRSVITVSPKCSNTLVVSLMHWTIEVTLEPCTNPSNLLVELESNKVGYEAIVHNGRVLTVKLKAQSEH